MNAKLRKRSLIFICAGVGVALMVILLPSLTGHSPITGWYWEQCIRYLSWSQSVYHLDWLTLNVIVVFFLLYRRKRKRDVHDPFRLQAFIEECQERKQEQVFKLLQAVKEYSVTVMSPYLKEQDLRILLFNIERWNLTRTGPLPSVSAHTEILSSDLRHFAWNIGERMGWSGPERAEFIKQTFQHQMEGMEMESIRRTLRISACGKIPLDIPEKGDWAFHPLPQH